MKKLILLLFISLFLTSEFFSQSQTEMNEVAELKYLKVDSELNDVYKQIRNEYRTNPKFLNNLKLAQRSWIEFRDASVRLMFPNNQTGQNYNGSSNQMCVFQELTNLTKNRIKELRLFLTGVEEGDVCFGSINIKN